MLISFKRNFSSATMREKTKREKDGFSSKTTPCYLPDCSWNKWGELFCLGMTAMSTFSPVGSRSSNGMRMCVCVCVCVDGMNLKYTVHWHIHISVHSILCQCYTQAHAHMHPQTIWGQRTVGAKCGYCRHDRITFWPNQLCRLTDWLFGQSQLCRLTDCFNAWMAGLHSIFTVK